MLVFKLSVEFQTEEARQDFMGWFCDGGGEDYFNGEGDYEIDYSKAFEAWGYRPHIDGDPVVKINTTPNL